VTRPTVAVLVRPGADFPPGLAEAEHLAELRLADSPEALGTALHGAGALFVWSYSNTANWLHQAWPSVDALRWIHTAGIGVDGVLIDEVVSSNVIVSNTRGIIERPVAEYVLALILCALKDVRRTLEAQARGTWSYRETLALQGRRALILGAGGVGMHVAHLMRAVGVDVTLVGRSERKDTIFVHAVARLDELLPHADFVIAALPLTGETWRLLNRERIARMRQGSYLVNVGRGAVIEEQALVDALQSGHLDGAALDVFEDEPLSAGHPFWGMANVIVSPHMAGDIVGWQEASVARFVANLKCWLAGLPLENVVDKDQLRLAPAAFG
jgi:phosphoglycerate dehydrogenase-like enzyme